MAFQKGPRGRDLFAPLSPLQGPLYSSIHLGPLSRGLAGWLVLGNCEQGGRVQGSHSALCYLSLCPSPATSRRGPLPSGSLQGRE